MTNSSVRWKTMETAGAYIAGSGSGSTPHDMDSQAPYSTIGWWQLKLFSYWLTSCLAVAEYHVTQMSQHQRQQGKLSDWKSWEGVTWDGQEHLPPGSKCSNAKLLQVLVRQGEERLQVNLYQKLISFDKRASIEKNTLVSKRWMTLLAISYAGLFKSGHQFQIQAFSALPGS